ncbi:MAG TPA: hypothetical protein VIV60_03630 [Polyangiaceae bacterium]
MIEHSKITPHHLSRCALVYVRQSTAAQVEDHRESTDLQYKLTKRAVSLGWCANQVDVIDQDLGVSTARRPGRKYCRSDTYSLPGLHREEFDSADMALAALGELGFPAALPRIKGNPLG